MNFPSQSPQAFDIDLRPFSPKIVGACPQSARWRDRRSPPRAAPQPDGGRWPQGEWTNANFEAGEDGVEGEAAPGRPGHSYAPPPSGGRSPFDPDRNASMDSPPCNSIKTKDRGRISPELYSGPSTTLRLRPASRFTLCLRVSLPSLARPTRQCEQGRNASNFNKTKDGRKVYPSLSHGVFDLKAL